MMPPQIRRRIVGNENVRADGQYVLYWMTSYRRGGWNFSLQEAVHWAKELKKPLVVLEALRCGYRWSNDRIHQFIIEGMVANAAHFARKPVTYYPYIEPKQDAGKGLLAAWARNACLVVSDDFPCFFLPNMYHAAAKQIPVRFELIDSNGMLPMRAAEKVFARAFDFRRFLQKHLLDHLDAMPDPDPLVGARLPRLPAVDPEIARKWPPTSLTADNDASAELLTTLPIDHSVAASQIQGGSRAAQKRLQTFVNDQLPRYGTLRNQPEQDVASGLSPYLHAGHISAHQIFTTVAARDGWRASQTSAKANGSAQGWWGASEEVESFWDELITWRELGYNMCHQRDDYDQYDSLPAWARQTLSEHADDTRTHLYSLAQFENAETHDPLWNAAQNQLVQEGRIHNYLRMLWGKKVLEWTASPRDALHILIELNNKYALDGRNPNSYSGIFWCFGRYDRAWGPERPVFGKIRFMSSDNTARKVRVKQYIHQYSTKTGL